jgi:uncharacterized SAM-binding protein YcdF (DUF218 family)
VRRLKNLLACLGALAVLVTLVPPAWYAAWLAQPWTEARAPVLIVLAGESVRDGMMGTSSYWRSVFAVDVFHEGGIRRIVLTGDPQTTASMRTWLIDQGIPAGAIAVEGNSHSTRENALFTAALIDKDPGPFLLLTSDIHTWRARRAFLKAGLSTLPRPAPDAFKRGNDWRQRWTVFLDIATECVKIVYYKSKGWV